MAGIDSFSPVTFNFGAEPFAFDLTEAPAALHASSRRRGAASASKRTLNNSSDELLRSKQAVEEPQALLPLPSAAPAQFAAQATASALGAITNMP